jgi:hypothetical protein
MGSWYVVHIFKLARHKLCSDRFSFRRSASFRHSKRVYNVIPGDYTHDGKLDVLVMAQSTSSTQLSLSIYTAAPGGGFRKLLFQTHSAPLIKSFA